MNAPGGEVSGWFIMGKGLIWAMGVLINHPGVPGRGQGSAEEGHRSYLLLPLLYHKIRLSDF